MPCEQNFNRISSKSQENAAAPKLHDEGQGPVNPTEQTEHTSFRHLHPDHRRCSTFDARRNLFYQKCHDEADHHSPKK